MRRERLLRGYLTAHKRAVAELACAEELFRGAFDGSPIGMALTDGLGHVARVNGALCALTGRAHAELTGVRLEALVHPDEMGYDRNAIARLIGRERDQHEIETRLMHATGASVWVTVQATMIRGDAGDAGGARRFLVQVQDVSHRRRYEASLHHLATHDPLTGLHNRSSFARLLDAHADLVRRYGSEGALLLLDLDHFKYVNDTLGHQAGDHVIARVAKVLAARLRDSDVLARLGGDEFAVLLPKAEAVAAQRVAGALLATLRAERIAVPGTGGRTITASIGVATFERDEALSGEDVLVNADLAMYDAKEAGRNQVVLHAGEQAQVRMQGRVTWAQRIRDAIDDERFTLVAQPILDLRTGVPTRFEVLLRMLDPHGDLIPPSAFMATAERLGMIQEIDALVVARAIRAVAAAGAAIGDSRVEINLSGASMGDARILRVIERELRETGLDPARVIFEITETTAIANIADARDFSDELARLGCRFALDDFGAGFGSFYYLKHVNFDVLKIDGEFVRDACATRTDRLVIEAVVAIARGLGKQTVAEHVGDEQTVALLRELGVDYGQGYFLGRPEPLERFLAQLAGGRGRATAQHGGAPAGRGASRPGDDAEAPSSIPAPPLTR